MKFILIIISSLLVSACVSTSPTVNDPGMMTIQTGSILILNQPLAITQGKARTGVQHGKAVAGVNVNEPYCEFLINTIAKTTTTLPAGSYRITKNRGFQVPYATNYYLNITALRLESSPPSDIRQVECGIVSSGYESRYLTIKEFEMLAGDVMTLQATGKQ